MGKLKVFTKFTRFFCKTYAMSLDNVHQLLTAYTPVDENEAYMWQETIHFIEAHPDCLLRTCIPGHLTASAWIVDKSRKYALLTHHRKLDKWLQLGGHADGEASMQKVALTEAYEESGLSEINLVSEAVFDVDVHIIPANSRDPEHKHYDIRFLLEADRSEPLQISHESKDLAWVEIEKVPELNNSESLIRMVRKHWSRFGGQE